MAKSRKAISVRGGGTFYYREIDPTPSNTYLEAGYIASSELDDVQQMVGEVDESGVLPDIKSGSQIVKWKMVLKQATQAVIDLLRNAAGKYYEGYYVVLLANGQYQEISIPVFTFSPNVNLRFAAATERQVACELNCLAPKAAYTRGVTAFNVVKDQPYIVLDGASATFNTSNTEASALATAIM
jgi:hypothetical protein